MLDQQPIVFVLREDSHRGIGAGSSFAARPEIDRGDFMRLLDDRRGKAELAIELERARLDPERA